MAKKIEDEFDPLAVVQRIQQGQTAGQAMGNGQSFFPAAQRTTLGNTPSGQLTNYSPYQNTPGQNPAYQAAIAGGRPSRTGFTTIPTPSGGTMSVPAGRVDRYASLLAKGAGLNFPPNENMVSNPITGTQGTFPAASRVISSGINQPSTTGASTSSAFPTNTATPTELLFGGRNTNPLLGVGFGSGAAPATTTAARFFGQGTINKRGQTTVGLPSGGTATVGPATVRDYQKPRSYAEMGVY